MRSRKLNQYQLLRFALVVCLALFVTAATLLAVAAAPLPPRIAVNHQTRQCARVLPGDECGDAVLPPDWEYLPQGTSQCPADYKEIELRLAWSHFKADFCCTQYHSGSPGDCADVIVQEAARQCAFVNDISQCASLPEGWQAWGQNCPEGFTWAGDQACPAAPPGAPTAAPGPEETGTYTAAPPKATPTSPEATATAAPLSVCGLPMPCGSAAGMVILALALFARRRRQAGCEI